MSRARAAGGFGTTEGGPRLVLDANRKPTNHPSKLFLKPLNGNCCLLCACEVVSTKSSYLKQELREGVGIWPKVELDLRRATAAVSREEKRCKNGDHCHDGRRGVRDRGQGHRQQADEGQPAQSALGVRAGRGNRCVRREQDPAVGGDPDLGH